VSKKLEFKSISIKEEFAESIEAFVKEHPEFGYRSIAQFLEDASRRRLEDLKRQVRPLPRFEQVNCDEQGCKVLDRQLKRVADIIIKPEGIRCSIHHTDTCEHVEFALSQKEVQQLIKKRKLEGWKLPDV
jgi:hypothetical protein